MRYWTHHNPVYLNPPASGDAGQANAEASKFAFAEVMDSIMHLWWCLTSMHDVGLLHAVINHEAALMSIQGEEPLLRLLPLMANFRSGTSTPSNSE